MDMLILKDAAVLRDDNVVLNEVCLTVADGITVCLGSPGSGKTTLCETVLGLIRPSKGEVNANCKTALAAKDAELLSRLTLIENVKIHLSMPKSKLGTLEILKMLGLEQVAGAQYKKLTPLQKSLSKLGCAMSASPALIICDDCTSGLNTRDKQKFYEILKKLKCEYGYSFLIVSGDETAASIADKLYSLSDGKITEVKR